MKKIAVKICSVLLISTLILAAAYLAGSDFGGISKVSAAQSDSSCKIYREAQYVGGGTGTWWAYEDYTYTQGETTIEGIRLIDYHGPYGAVTVPDYIDGKRVLSVIITNNCFYKEDKATSITSITLPSTLTEIGDYAFKGMTALSSIEIPEGVEKIGDYAFYNCSKLASIDFPDTLKIIGTNPFYGCSAFKASASIDLPDSVEVIGPSAFYGFTKLTSIELPESLKAIDSSAFYDCRNLTSIVFPDSLETVNSSAFYVCTNLTEVVFNEGLSCIGDKAFYNCNLQNVEFKDGLETIGDYAFRYNANLKTVKLPEGLTYLGTGFISDTAVEELDLPDSLKSAGKFLDGTKIKEIVLPPNFAKLKSGMLSSNSTLESLETLTVQDTDVEKIPFSNLKTFIFKGKGEISENPFYTVVAENYNSNTHTSYTVTVVYPPETFIFTDAINTNVHKILIDDFNYYLHIDPETGYYIYSKEYSGEEEFRPLGNSFTSGDYVYDTTAGGGAVITAYNGTETGVLTVPDSFENEGVTYPVVAIGQKAFMESTATEIVLPETVKKIEAYAFYNNDNLTKTNLPEGIKVIEPYTYGACNGILEINIPESVVYIGDEALSGSDVTELVIPQSVKAIGEKAFYSTTCLNSLTLPEGLEKIGERAFANGQHYVSDTTFGEYSLTLPSSIKEIGEGAFEYSRVSGEVIIPESITKIPGSMFRGSEYLTSVVMHGGITEIGEMAFHTCFYLTSAPLLTGLETIGEMAFLGAGLTSITIPTTVTSLGERAFAQTDITAITIPANVKTVPSYCFESCYSLKNVTIANGVERIEAYAFAHSGSYDRIVLPPSILEISDYVFQDVERIENFVFNVTCYESDLSHWYNDDDSPRFGYFFYSQFYANVQIGKLTIGGNVKYIPEELAYGAIIDEVILPNNVVAIGASAFQNCTVINPLVIPNSVKTIYECAFDSATIYEITLPENLETLKDMAFYDFYAETVYYNCTNCVYETSSPDKTEIEGVYESPFSCSEITNFVIGENVEALPDFIFCNVYGLVTVHIPDNIKSLSKGAFAFSGVEKVTGMSSLTAIEDYTFYKCGYLTSIEAENSRITKAGKYAFAYSGIESISSLDSLTSLGDYAFYKCEHLASTGIENSKITKAGKYAFAYSGIENLNGLEALTTVDDYAFYKCPNLTEIDLTNFKAADIGIFAFSGSGVTSFTGSELLESVADNSFENCTNLTDVNLGTKIMLIGNNAFKGCTALKEITIPDSVKNIGDQAFADCTALETVCMSASVDYIPTECFANDTALSSFIWNAENKLIGRMAFSGCTSLSEFDFIGIKKLYESSFCNSGIKVVSLGEALDNAAAALEEIQAQSFRNCAELETITIGGNVSTVSSLAFAGCPNLEIAVISDNVTEIADDAFDDCPNLNFVCSPTSYAYAYASANGIPVSTLVIAAIPNQTYTGSYIRPEVKVSFSNTSLTRDIDFTVSYSNNKNVGQATVTVSGKGSYDMLVSKAKFTIVTRNISKATIAEIKAQKYTGEAIEPSLTITDNGRYLKEGTDYKVSYYDNVSHGKAYVSVVGKGNYSGSVQTTFMIEELGSSEDTLNWFESFLRDFFARFISIFLTLGFKIS